MPLHDQIACAGIEIVHAFNRSAAFKLSTSAISACSGTFPLAAPFTHFPRSSRRVIDRYVRRARMEPAAEIPAICADLRARVKNVS